MCARVFMLAVMPPIKMILSGRIMFAEMEMNWVWFLKILCVALSLQMRMNVHQVVTGVTPTLVVGTSLALISVSAIRASTEMDTLVLVGDQFVCFPLVCATSGAEYHKVSACDNWVSAWVCQQHLSTQPRLDKSPLKIVFVYRHWWVCRE